jgi:hypothetical protein
LTHIPYQTPAISAFKDRSTTLLVVGILFIIAGALCGCMTLTIPLALVVPRPSNMPPQRVANIVVGLIVYAALCAALLTLGIGCVRKRRWVRPLIIVFAWIGLAGGVMGIVMWAFTLPNMANAMRAAVPPGTTAPPPAFYNAMVAVMTVFFLFIYLIVPGVLLMLFRPADVQATLAHYDPTPRWTDGVPMPVLALCVLLAIGALWPLTCAVQGWFFAFGALLSGVVARVVALLVAAAFATAMLLAFRRRPAGWWVAIALFILVPLAWITTLLRHGLVEVYRASGMSDSELRAVGNMPLMSSAVMAASMGVVAIGTIAFTVAVRKYFTSHELPPAPPAEARSG